jgi:hypothetical protein
MKTSAQYREYADECVRLAKAANTEHQRGILLEMAEAWRSLAAQADRKNPKPEK